MQSLQLQSTLSNSNSCNSNKIQSLLKISTENTSANFKTLQFELFAIRTFNYTQRARIRQSYMWRIILNSKKHEHSVDRLRFSLLKVFIAKVLLQFKTNVCDKHIDSWPVTTSGIYPPTFFESICPGHLNPSLVENKRLSREVAYSISRLAETRDRAPSFF